MARSPLPAPGAGGTPAASSTSAKIAALAGLCALLWAWSRIDLRKTAVSLDLAERQYHAARADQARLKLELATLRDPARLERVGATLNLDREVPVVVVPAPIAPGTPAGEVAAR